MPGLLPHNYAVADTYELPVTLLLAEQQLGLLFAANKTIINGKQCVADVQFLEVNIHFV